MAAFFGTKPHVLFWIPHPNNRNMQCACCDFSDVNWGSATQKINGSQP